MVNTDMYWFPRSTVVVQCLSWKSWSFKKFPFIESEGSLTHLQKPTTGSYPDPVEFSVMSSHAISQTHICP